MTQLLIIGGYLTLLLALGAASSQWFRGTRRDYLLASHSIGPFLLLMSLFGTTMTAFALVGSSGEAYSEGIGVYGLLASSSGVVHSLCFFVIGVPLWKLGKKHGFATQIQFFRDRLESDRIGLLLFPILVGLVIPYLLIGVLSSGAVITSITEGAFLYAFDQYDYAIPPWLGSLIISMVVLAYVFVGGMRGTAWANAFQTCVFMTLGVVTFVVVSQKMGGVKAATERVADKHPSRLMRGVDPADQARFDEQFAAWRTLARYVDAREQRGLRLNPEQRAAAHAQIEAGPDWALPFREVRAEARYADSMNLLPPLTPAELKLAELRLDDRVIPEPLPDDFLTRPLGKFPRDRWEPRAIAYFKDRIGHPHDPARMTIKQALGRYRAQRWAPEPPHAMSQWAFLTYLFIPLSVGMFPHVFQHWLTARSADSFKLPIVAHPLFIAIVWLPCIAIGVWATSASMPGNPQVPLIPPHFNPNGVLAYVVGQLTNPVLAGLLTAGILAAIMSSLDSQFLCLGTIFTEDIVLHYGGRERFSETQSVWLARGFIVGIVAVTYLFSLFEMRRVFTLGVWTFSGFSALFPLIFAALHWRGLTAAGAAASVLTAAVSWVWLFRESGWGSDPNFTAWGMNPVAPILALATASLIVVSLVTKRPSEATLARFFPPSSAPSQRS